MHPGLGATFLVIVEIWKTFIYSFNKNLSNNNNVLNTAEH